MCGRYYIEVGDDEMQDIIRAVEKNMDSPEFLIRMKTGEIFPSDIVPVQTGDTTSTLMKWGFSRYDGKGLVINARSETAFEKPMFRKPLLESRCVIPASYYFEWEKVGAKKIKNAFKLPNSNIIYLAGIYRLEKDAELPTFTILTKDAAPHVAHIHERMPVIIPKPLVHEWLHEGAGAMHKSDEDVVFEVSA